jgi:ABC-type nitrate/sulfonate/bicarbonate transport system permease component
MSVTVIARRPHPPNLRVRGVVDSVAPATISLGVGALGWELLARIWNVSFFPPLSVVVLRLVQLTEQGQIVESLVQSLINLGIGFAISVTVGVTVGALMGAYRRVAMALDVYVYALLTAPTLVFAPIFFALFGLSRITIILVIVFYSVFIVIVNTAAAIRSVPPSLIEMGRSFCASDRQLFLKVILPAALPLTMAGLRLAMGRAVKGMINGEMFIAAVGLGAVVINAGRRFDAPAVLAVLLVIVVVAMVSVKLVQIVDARLTSWLPSTARARRRRGA